jgi:predicted DNA-binding protein
MSTTKIKIDSELYERVKKFADMAGYSSVDEFVAHALEKEISALDDVASEDEVRERLKGLGYLS